MKKSFLIPSLLSILLSGCLGLDGAFISSGTGDHIPFPGNLVSNTDAIKTEGVNVIEITNNGETKLELKDVSLTTDTKDELIKEDTTCINVTLHPKQICKVSLIVYARQDGTDNVAVRTDVGEYKFPIHIDTKGEGDKDLTINTTKITKAGNNVIEVKNEGKTKIAMHDISLTPNSTNDNLTKDGSSCFDAILAPQDTCVLNLYTQKNEAGTDDLHFKTSIGDYNFSIEIDVGGQMIDTDVKLLSEIQPYTINVKNISTIPMTLTRIDSTITLTNKNCIDHPLNPQEACQIILQPSPQGGVYANHALTFITSNSLIKPQVVNIVEDTVLNQADVITDISSITSPGQQTVHVINNTIKARHPHQLNFTKIKLTDEWTQDELISSTCLNKTLAPNESCAVVLNIIDKEAGYDTINLTTSIGTYNSLLNIDNEGSGVVELGDIILDSTREKKIDVYNKGKLALKINGFNVVDHTNDGFTVTDINCANEKSSEILAGKACQILAKARPNKHTQHTIYFSTNNPRLKKQSGFIHEKTDKTEMSFLLDNEKETQSDYFFSNPTTHDIVIKNTGTNDLNIKTITLDNSSVGYVDNNCNNKLLQAGDTCTAKLTIRDDAYGDVEKVAATLKVNTEEDTIDGFKNPAYNIHIDNPNLQFVNDNKDLTIHKYATREVKLINKSNFIVKTSGAISYNNQLIKLDSSSCPREFAPNQSCDLKIVSNGQVKDTQLQIPEYDNKLQHTLNIHISDGVTVVQQPAGSSYYNVLPHDNNLYQVFTVANNGDTTQQINISKRNGVLELITNQLPAPAYLLPKCFENNTFIVKANSQCELIMREPNDTNALSELDRDEANPDKGNLRFNINYITADHLTHKYQAHVNRHHEHKDAPYPPDTAINADKSVGNNVCGIKNGQATYITEYAPSIMGVGRIGMVLTGDLFDENTMKAIIFQVHDFRVPAGEKCLYKVNIKVPLRNFTQDERVDHILYEKQGSWERYVDLYTLAGSWCNGAICQISLHPKIYDDLNPQLSNGAIDIGNITWSSVPFTQPQPAKDFDVVDGVSWSDLGVFAIKYIGY